MRSVSRCLQAEEGSDILTFDRIDVDIYRHSPVEDELRRGYTVASTQFGEFVDPNWSWLIRRNCT